MYINAHLAHERHLINDARYEHDGDHHRLPPMMTAVDVGISMPIWHTNATTQTSPSLRPWWRCWLVPIGTNQHRHHGLQRRQRGSNKKPPLGDSSTSPPSGDSASDALALRVLPSSSGEIGWDIIYRLRDAIRPWQNPKFGYSHGPIASLRTHSLAVFFAPFVAGPARCARS